MFRYIKRYFEKKNEELSKSLRRRDKEKIEKEIYYYLKRRKAIKYFKDIEIEEVKKETIESKAEYKKRIIKCLIKYKINEDQIEKEELLDGVYVICSNLHKDYEGKDIQDVELISSYRRRIKIERAFLDIKQLLELRPIYHREDFRIKAHLLICVIAYLLNVTLEYRVRDAGKLDITSRMVYEILEGCNADEIEIKNIKEKRLKIVNTEIEQKKIIEALGYEDILEEKRLLLG